jgi:choline dehydrogenase
VSTPGVLLRSGIGPRADLARLGVTPVVELPAVGARLLDHPGAAIILRARWGVSSLRHPLIQTMLRFTSKDSPYPNDMQVQPGSFLPLHPRITLPTVTLMTCVGKPRGVGTIHFPSADPHARPILHSGMLVDKADHARAVEGLRIAYECARTPAMRELAHFFWPAERVLHRVEDLGTWIYRSCGSGYHPCGTVPMGPDGDPAAAVDEQGRVRGVEGLIVADASIFPTIPSANTNLTALMVGERFGEWLREQAI